MSTKKQFLGSGSPSQNLKKMQFHPLPLFDPEEEEKKRKISFGDYDIAALFGII